MVLAEQHTIVACLRLVCETNVAEILREAGPEVSPLALTCLVRDSPVLRTLRGYMLKPSQPRPSCTLVN